MPLHFLRVMQKYKIIYDRQNCIGVSSCALLAEDFWKMAADDKADLVGSKENSSGVWERHIDEKDLEKNKEAARNCPVGVIKIVDENGKQIAP